jgi:O-antigen biosynthesis protein
VSADNISSQNDDNMNAAAAARSSLSSIAASARPKILFISHNWGGGTQRHIDDLITLIADDADVLTLTPHDAQTVKLSWRTRVDSASPETQALAGTFKAYEAYFKHASEWTPLVELLKSLRISRVHLHHVQGLPQSVLSLDAVLDVPLDVTLHDHFVLSPNYILYPGGKVEETGKPNQWNLSLSDWQAAMHVMLRRAARVIAPSQYLANRISAQWPEIQPLVRPHPERAFLAAHVLNVVVLGRLSSEKGLYVVRDVAAAAKTAAPDGVAAIHVHVIGALTEPLPTYPELPLSVGGEYDEKDLPALIDRARADVIWFPSQCPESFSYTLTAALASGVPIVSSNLGAIAERLAGLERGTVLAWDATPKDWLRALVAGSGRSSEVGQPVSRAAPSNLALQYRDFYLGVLSPNTEKNNNNGATSQTSSGPISLKASNLMPPKSLSMLTAGDQLPIETLYSLGVDAGQLGARRELKRRALESEQQLALSQVKATSLQQQIDEISDVLTRMNRHVGNLESDLAQARLDMQNTRDVLEHERDAARAAFEDISNATMWRMTAPLRFALHGVKRLFRGGRDIAIDHKNLPHRLNVAKQILQNEGPVALGKRVHERLTRAAEMPAKPTANYQQELSIAPLAINAASAPQMTIIIPVYGQHVMTYTCLKSIAETCGDESIEVIVIDDSTPAPDGPASEALAPVTGITVVRNETNLGFLRNCNKAAAMAKGEFIVLLNNDTIVTKGWLAAMRRVWDERRDVGMVGAKLIYPDGVLQEAGGILWRDGSAWNWGRNQDASLPPYNYLREVDYCSGACLMIRRDFWSALGGFDERYAPAYYEDTDLSFRVREEGKRVYYQPAATIVHFEGRSSGTDVSQGIKKYQVINQETFFARWKHVLSTHRINGLLPQLERDRYAKRRVLVIDACMITPDQDSGSLRMFEMLGVMAKLDCKVTFLADNLEYREPYVSQIQALGVEVIYHPVHSNVTRFLERHASEYEVIMLSRATVAVKHIDTVKNAAPRARVIFDTVDLHFLRQEREAELANDAIARAAAARMKRTELEIMSKADVTLVVSPVEEKLLDEIAPDVRVSIVSNIHVPMPGAKAFSERSGAIFIGGFRHPPNLDAITWYVENVLPILRAKNANIITTVIGSNAPPSLQKFAADDFVIAGFVPDVTPYYDAARLSISPLRYGAGVKGKVNISMQYGVPVVATSPSVEGMYLCDGADVLRADDAEAFADAMIRANTDEALWNTLRMNGLQNIETHFSRITARRALSPLLEVTDPNL